MPSDLASYSDSSVATIVAKASSSLRRLVKVADERCDNSGWPLTSETRGLEIRFYTWVKETKADTEPSSPGSFEIGFDKKSELSDIKFAIVNLGLAVDRCMYDTVLVLFLVLTRIVITLIGDSRYEDELLRAAAVFERHLRSLKYMVNNEMRS